MKRKATEQFPLTGAAAQASIELLEQRRVLGKADADRLRVLARALPAAGHKLLVSQALPLLFGADTPQKNAETSLRKLDMRVHDQQDDAVSVGRLLPGERLNLVIERKNAQQSHQLWFSGLSITGAHARTHDLESVAHLYDNAVLPPELLGQAPTGMEPILLLTVNDIETQALREVFCSVDQAPLFFKREGHPYVLLRRATNGRPLIAFRCEMGSLRSGAAVMRTTTAILHHKPSAVLAVGIAFGRRGKQQLGDVLVSEQVHSYEPARVNPDGGHMHRSEIVPATSSWLDCCIQIPPSDYKQHKGLLLCGEKLVDNADFREALNTAYPAAIGGDMESAGMVTACLAAKVDWIVVKGVSDWGDGTKGEGTEAQKDAAQWRAALNAARTAYAAIFLKPWVAAAAGAAGTTRSGSLPVQARTRDFDDLPTVMELHGRGQAMVAMAQPSDSPALTSGLHAHEALQRWLQNAEAPPVFALLGEYGMGKTISCQRLNAELCRLRAEGAPPDWARQPLYLDLRNLSLFKNMDRHGVVPLPKVAEMVEDLISHGWTAPLGQALPSFSDVQAQLSQGALLILDGLDECLVHLTEAQHPQFVSSWLNLLADMRTQATGPQKARLLLSCRTNFFKTLADQRNLFTSQHRGKVDAAWYEAMELLPLTAEQIEGYLRATLPELDQARVLALIADTHNLGELAERPMTLKLLGRHIPALEAAKQRGETVNGAALYELVAQEWLERDHGKHHLAPEHKLRLMPALAAHLWRLGVRSLPYDELHQWFHRWRASQPDLAERYGPTAYNQTKLEEDLRTATFVVRQAEDEAQPEGFRFAHSSLAEFFLARHLADAVLHDRPADWVLPQPSKETLCFLAELLSREADRLRHGKRGRDLQATLNTWRRSYRAQASELLLAYTLQDLGTPKHALAPRPLLSGFNLAGAKLRDLALGDAGANEAAPLLAMTGCDFTGADLRGSRWHRVRLDDSCFEAANLAQAAFEHCSLQATCWSQAQLIGTVLRGCALQGSQWKGAGDMYRLQFVGCAGAESLLASSNAESWPLVEVRGVRDRPESGCLAWLPGHVGSVQSVAWSPDGMRLLSGSDDGRLKVWDARSGEGLLTLAGHQYKVMCVAWSPDGKQFASAGDRSFKLWDARSGESILTVTGHEGGVRCVAWAPEGRRVLSGGSDGLLKLWDARSGKCLQILTGHEGSVTGVVWSPDGKRLYSGGADGKVKLWDALGGECLSTLIGHDSQVTSIALSSDGRQLLSSGADRGLKIWDVQSARLLLTLANDRDVTSASYSPDGRQLLSGDVDGKLQIWDAQSGECLRTLIGYAYDVRSVAWSPDGAQLLTAGDDRALKLWDARSGECLLTLAGDVLWVMSVVWSPDGGRLLSGDQGRTLKVWNSRSGACLMTLAGHTDGVLSVAWSRDGTRLLSGGIDGKLKLWDAQSGECLRTLAAHESWVSSVAWSPDGTKALSGGMDGRLKVWDTHSGRCILEPEGHQDRLSGGVASVAWSPDGGQLLSGGHDGALKLWDASSGACLLTLAGHKGWMTSVAWSPDGKRLLSGGGDATLRTWDASSGRCLMVLAGLGGRIRSVAWSPDGTRLLSGSIDGKPRLWDARNGECLLTLVGHESWVISVAWSRDGEQILSGGADGTLRLWNSHSGECTHAMTTWGGRDQPFSHAVWRPARLDDPSDGGEVLQASGEAWRYLAWQVWDHPRAPGEWTRLPLGVDP